MMTNDDQSLWKPEMKKKKDRKKKKPYIPRIVIKMNTGTRTMLSKKDKAQSRKELNKRTRDAW